MEVRQVLMSLWLLLAATVATAQPLQDFAASYELVSGSSRAGEATLRLEKTSAGLWLYQLDARSSGWLDWILRYRLQESCLLEQRAMMLKPLKFQLQQSGKNKKQESVEFDWKEHKAISRWKDRTAEISLSGNETAGLCQELALLAEFSPGQSEYRFQVIRRSGKKSLVFQSLGIETIELPAGRLEAYHMRLIHDGQQRSTDIWLSSDSHPFPVKIVHQERPGEDPIIMQLKQIK